MLPPWRWLLALMMAAACATAAESPNTSVSQTTNVVAEFEELVAAEYVAFAQNLNPIHEFDDLFVSPEHLGSGVYFEFDTQFGEVVRTGQIASATGSWKNANSPLPLASASKLFTGVAAMRTMQLKPDEFYPEKRVHEFEGWRNFSNFKVYGTGKRANLSIHQLLTHTSGLPFCLKCSLEDVEDMELFYWPGTYYGYTLGHRVIGWLLRDFWKSQPEGRAAGIKTVEDTYRWLVFSKLGLSPNTKFMDSCELVFGYSGKAGDACVESTGEDFIRLAVLALRRGTLPSGEQLISVSNWNRWAVPNLLPEGKLSEQLIGWRASSVTWQNFNVDDVKVRIMKQSGGYGWNYFGATYYDSREIGWCGFFSSCLRVTYRADLAFVMIQRNVADLVHSKPFLVKNFDAMARSLQCKEDGKAACGVREASTTFCQQARAGGECVLEPWTPSCPSMAKLGLVPGVQQTIHVPENRHVCYKPHCQAERCTRRTGRSCHLSNCVSLRGKASCEEGECVCADGFCAVGGVCTPTATCRQDTGGTCNVLGCDLSRGPTRCENGRCLCMPGFCEANGQCEFRKPVINETCIGPVGTCAILPCWWSRGPVVCVEGKCMCPDGYCPENGKCVPANGMLAREGSFQGGVSGPLAFAAAVSAAVSALVACLSVGPVCVSRRRPVAGGTTAPLLGGFEASG